MFELLKASRLLIDIGLALVIAFALLTTPCAAFAGIRWEAISSSSPARSDIKPFIDSIKNELESLQKDVLAIQSNGISDADQFVRHEIVSVLSDAKLSLEQFAVAYNGRIDADSCRLLFQDRFDFLVEESGRLAQESLHNNMHSSCLPGAVYEGLLNDAIRPVFTGVAILGIKSIIGASSTYEPMMRLAVQRLDSEISRLCVLLMDQAESRLSRASKEAHTLLVGARDVLEATIPTSSGGKSPEEASP
jgi:hypothetical protein